MEVAALGPERLDALRALAARADVARYGDHEPTAPAEIWSEWLGTADGNRRLTLGAFDADALVAAARLTLRARRRKLHCARLELLAPFEGGEAAARALVDALLDVADRWLQVVRITHVAPTDHPYVSSVFAPAGFAVEGVRRDAVMRDGALADEVLLARVDPRVTIARAGPPFEVPSPGPPLTAIVRPIRVGDAAAMARVYSNPRVVWGTLQLPFQRADMWTARFESNDPASITTLAVEVEGVFAGAGAIHLDPCPRRAHSASIGMGLAPEFQGRTLGRQLLDALLVEGDRRGVHRVELEVWEDNERAHRLYRSRGFEPECVERAIGFREGAYVTDLSMARLAARSSGPE